MPRVRAQKCHGIIGAQVRLLEIEREQAMILQAFPELQKERRPVMWSSPYLTTEQRHFRRMVDQTSCIMLVRRCTQ